MSYSHVLFHVIAVGSILHTLWCLTREHKPRNRLLREPRDCERFAPWQVHAPNKTRRQF